MLYQKSLKVSLLCISKKVHSCLMSPLYKSRWQVSTLTAKLMLKYFIFGHSYHHSFSQGLLWMGGGDCSWSGSLVEQGQGTGAPRTPCFHGHQLCWQRRGFKICYRPGCCGAIAAPWLSLYKLHIEYWLHFHVMWWALRGFFSSEPAEDQHNPAMFALVHFLEEDHYLWDSFPHPRQSTRRG